MRLLVAPDRQGWSIVEQAKPAVSNSAARRGDYVRNIDLADAKQMVVVCDHDPKILA
jgi:hypothetical protein